MIIKTQILALISLGLIALTFEACNKNQAATVPVQINEGRTVVKTDHGPYIGVDQEAYSKLEEYRLSSNSASATFHFGRPATEEEIAAWDIDVPPDGQGLPKGSGNVVDGAAIYAMKCAVCHGDNGEGIKPNGALVASESNGKTIGSYWPYATTIFDYVRRSMPFNTPGSLSDQEVYAITAFLLYKNKIIEEDMTIDAKSLPNVVMPNQEAFIPDDREKYNAVH